MVTTAIRHDYRPQAPRITPAARKATQAERFAPFLWIAADPDTRIPAYLALITRQERSEGVKIAEIFAAHGRAAGESIEQIVNRLWNLHPSGEVTASAFWAGHLIMRDGVGRISEGW